MDAFITAIFQRRPGGALSLFGSVLFETQPGVYNSDAQLDLPYLATDTDAQFAQKVRDAVDAAAIARGLAVPTKIYWQQPTRLRG